MRGSVNGGRGAQDGDRGSQDGVRGSQDESEVRGSKRGKLQNLGAFTIEGEQFWGGKNFQFYFNLRSLELYIENTLKN